MADEHSPTSMLRMGTRRSFTSVAGNLLKISSPPMTRLLHLALGPLSSSYRTERIEIEECMNGLYRRWVENRRRPVQVEMKQRLHDLTFNMLIQMIVRKQRFFDNGILGVRSDEAEEAIKMSGVLDTLPFLKWLDLRGVTAELNAILSGFLKEHRRKRLFAQRIEGINQHDYMECDGV
ncbi:hypothetical protein ACLOJK_041207 [Asimina triloba]